MPPPPPRLFDRFWAWYERHYTLNVSIAASLFTLQLVHLFWLTTDVVWMRLFGWQLFEPGLLGRYFIIAVDYTEIPALVTTSLVYLSDLRRSFSWKSIWFLFFLNSQWLHLFWITDAFVVQVFASADGGTAFPVWLAWIAILIDYLELPVIVDTLQRVFASAKQAGVKEMVERALRYYTWRS